MGALEQAVQQILVALVARGRAEIVYAARTNAVVRRGRCARRWCRARMLVLGRGGADAAVGIGANGSWG
jgi:hypothetical protein